MSTMTKVFIVLTAILSVVASVLFVCAAAQWDNWKQLAQDYRQLHQAEATHRMNQQAIMEASLAVQSDALQDKDRDLAAAETRVRDLLNEVEDAKNDLARRTNEAVAAEAGRKKLEEILDVQTAELTAAQKQNQTLLTQNIDVQTRNTRLNSRVLELTSTTTIQNDQIRNLQERLYAAEQQAAELQQLIASGRRVAPSPERVAGVVPVAATVTGPIRGEIVEVDGNYASISIGETSGVVSGMTFVVHRGGRFLAELVIDKVRPKQAGGKLKIVQENVGPGDAVAYGLEGGGF